ncbi:MAG: hypothetical protein AUK43_01560 [Oscillatoriales cyanobacterium CG2_30_40_61]|nr:MAG: hypothetical protein AUK43_01560 [Oscillatoriales cyanobacterium CG2_30_40_61]
MNKNNRFLLRFLLFFFLAIGIILWSPTRQLAAQNPVAQTQNQTPEIKLEKVATEKVYFTYHGKPLLSFGGLSDFIFYASDDAYNYKQWANWAAEHGMNHLRAYPPYSWKYIEKFTQDNGGSLKNVLFPYQETQPGSRQFDLTKFNEAYWKRFREQVEYLQSKGIIIHLLMMNGWQMDDNEKNWGGHFFNPDNNINTFTDHLKDNRLKFYHSVADNQTELAEVQKAWFKKLIEVTADLDNVYYDLVHEVAENHQDWSKVKVWIDQMSTTVRDRFRELQPQKQIILGMDTGGLNLFQRDWIFKHPNFDLLIYGKKHTFQQAKDWRIKYQKPYIPQESWDENNSKYGYREPKFRSRTRKFFWKFMMAKCQQMDLYIKPRIKDQKPGYDHNYNPYGWNPLEKDTLVLRNFWNRLTDYPNLWFNGQLQSETAAHRYVLSSPKEAIAYLSSEAGTQNISFPQQTIFLKDLSLTDGLYQMDIFKPDQGVLSSQKIEVIQGKVAVQLPEFIDDMAVHFYQGTPLTSVPSSQTQPNYLLYGITALILGGLTTTLLTIFRG